MKKTRANDGRGIGHHLLSEIRRRAVAAVQAGQAPEDVAAAHGVNRTTIYDWLAKYRQGGWGALKARKRGGRTPKLDAKALRWIFRTVVDKRPDQLRFVFALWTCDLVSALIKRRFGVSLSRASAGRLLAQLGLSAQRPLWKAYQQDPAKVADWLAKDYPALRAQARREGAEIFFADEAGVRSDHHAGTTWGERGKTPVVRATGARFGFNMISAISPRGTLRFMVVEGRVNAGVFITFLQRLLASVRGAIVLIVDGHPSHKAIKTRRFVESTEGRLRLVYLPGYSPELNPDELVWNNLKNNLGRRDLRTPAKMKSAATAHLRGLQRRPEMVRSFFDKASTAYARAA